MPPAWSPTYDFLALTRAQSGVISRAQCQLLGISTSTVRRLIDRGWWASLVPGVYQLSGETTWLARAWAGILMAGPDAVLGGEAAAHLHGLRPEPFEITVYSRAQLVRVPGWRFIRSQRQGVGALPRTRVAETILDLAGDLRAEELLAVMADALVRRRVTPERLRMALADRPWQRQRALVAEVIGQTKRGVRSPLEGRYDRDVEVAHGLPVGTRQKSLGHGDSDVLYEAERVIVELDGREFHSGSRLVRDRERDNQHLLLGVTPLRFGWIEVAGDPCRVATLVAGALTAAGWTGVPTPCPRCRRVVGKSV